MTTITTPSRDTPFAKYILIGLIAGIALGFLLNIYYLAADNEKLAALDVSIGQVEAQAHQATDAALIRTQAAEGPGDDRNAFRGAEKGEPYC
jgi:hypothetical protein